MAQIFRVTTEWTGFTGGPGFTNFFFRNVLPGGAPSGVDERVSALAATERTRAFWSSIAEHIPDDVTFRVAGYVDVLEDTTGELVDSISLNAIAPVQGQSVGVYSGASGAVVSWGTSEIRNGRRIRGRTFLVPLAGARYTTNGRIDSATVTDLQDAADDLAIGGVNSTFGVWGRPSGPNATDGVWAEAVSVRVRDVPAILRSRRD